MSAQVVDVPDSWETCDPETIVVPEAKTKTKTKTKEEEFERTFDLPEEVEAIWNEPIRVEKPKPLPAPVPKTRAEPKDMAGRICKHGFFPNSGPECQVCEDEAEEAFVRRIEEAERDEHDDGEWARLERAGLVRSKAEVLTSLFGKK